MTRTDDDDPVDEGPLDDGGLRVKVVPHPPGAEGDWGYPGPSITAKIVDERGRQRGFVEVELFPDRRLGRVRLAHVDRAMRGRGIGTEVYTKLNVELQKDGMRLASDDADARSPEAERVWRGLVKRGVARPVVEPELGTYYVMEGRRSDVLSGGHGDDLGPGDVDTDQLARGTVHEMEHTDDRDVARDIAYDHLAEDPAYYDHLPEGRRSRRRRMTKRLRRAHDRGTRAFARELRRETREMPTMSEVFKISESGVSLDDAWESEFTREEVRAELKRHGADLAEFVEEVGDRPKYGGSEVLGWLGY